MSAINIQRVAYKRSTRARIHFIFMIMWEKCWKWKVCEKRYKTSSENYQRCPCPFQFFIVCTRGVVRGGAMGALSHMDQWNQEVFRPQRLQSPTPGKKKIFKPPWTNSWLRAWSVPTLKSETLSFYLNNSIKLFCSLIYVHFSTFLILKGLF